jgi:hypothetical protein
VDGKLVRPYDGKMTLDGLVNFYDKMAKLLLIPERPLVSLELGKLSEFVQNKDGKVIELNAKNFEMVSFV